MTDRGSRVLALPQPRAVRAHQLKTLPHPFGWVWVGDKVHEIRKNDRDFRVGDILILREWSTWGSDPDGYSGRCVYAQVTHRTLGGSFGLPEDVCVMSIRVLSKVEGHVPKESDV